MKNPLIIPFLMISLLVVSVSCNDTEVLPRRTDFLHVIRNLEMDHRTVFTKVLQGTLEGVYANTFKSLKEYCFDGNLNLEAGDFSDMRVNDFSVGPDLSFLTYEQYEITQPFLTEIMSLETAVPVTSIVDTFNAKVVASALNDEQKYQLLSIGTSIKIGAEFIQGVSNNQEGPDARIERVDVKRALQAGVLGIGVGAVRGAFVGCSGGTIVFPGLGTATGCVGGAVIGGAVGFIGGVATSILQDILFG